MHRQRYFFVTPVLSKLFGKKFNFSSCLFCLYENPFSLDEKTCRDFIELDVNAILEGSIDSVITREKEYQTLFSDEEKTRFYDTDPDHCFTTTVLS